MTNNNSIFKKKKEYFLKSEYPVKDGGKQSSNGFGKGETFLG